MSFTPTNFTVWAEIPVRDLDRGMAFYVAATGGMLDRVEMGGDAVAVFRVADRTAGISANLFVGEPGPSDRRPVIYLDVEGRLEDAIARTAAAGGRILSEIVPIPAGRYVQVADPDGNRIGLFEAA